MPKQADIMVGRATVPAHEFHGWVLPGGVQITDKLKALEAANAIAAILDSLQPAPRIVNPGVRIIRRRPTSPLEPLPWPCG